MRDRLQFLLSEAFTALRRNGLMTFAAVSTSAVALFLLGGLAYVYMRVSAAAEDVSGKFEMRVWLKEQTTVAQVKEVAKKIRAIDGVKEARWVPKEHEWQRQRQEMPDVTEDLENPFPHSFKVVLTDLSKASDVSTKIQMLPSVETDGVTYMKAEQQFMDELLRFLRWLGFGLGGLLLATAGILIYNAIRLTIFARRREIRIMELVGASQFTVRTPFIIEGAVQGAVGGALAALLILAAQSAVQRQVVAIQPLTKFAPFPLWTAMGLLAIAGGIFGSLCSTLALREPLRSRTGGHL
jgi:cell division transport system permease protein